MNKTILTDVDGVLLDWQAAFFDWKLDQGFTPATPKSLYDMSKKFGQEKRVMQSLVRQFNESARIAYLDPLRDAVWGVKKLAEAGYRFKVITSLSLDEYAGRARTQNLIRLFGDVFDEFVYLDTGADKDEALSAYKDSGLYWVEDKPKNAQLGAKLGLNSLMIKHNFNKDIKLDGVTTVNSWSEICDLLLDH